HVAGGSLDSCALARRRFLRADLLQVAAQLAQLVAQLRGVLEAQVLGRRDHLLLELHDHPLERMAWSPTRPLLPSSTLGGAAFATTLADLRSVLRLALQELRDVRDAL